MLENILSSLGISAEESRIYVEILESGSVTAGELAKKVGLPRPTLYGILQRLTDKGIINRTLKYGVRTFSAAQPEKLNQLFKKQIDELQASQISYQEIIPVLNRKAKIDVTNPRFQLFEGIEGVQHVLKDMLIYRDLETLAFWPIKSMMEILSPEFFRYHNKERIRNNLYTRAIWPKSEAVDVAKNIFLGVGEEFRREIRIAPEENDFTMGYWLYKNKAAFLSSKSECFGFIIESNELVDMLTVQFELMWNISKPLKINPMVTQAFLDQMNSKKK